MKNFILGIVLGALAASAVWYFFIDNNTRNERRQLQKLIADIQQQEQSKETANAIINNSTPLSNGKTFTVIADDQFNYYFFEGSDCSGMHKGNIADVVMGLNRARLDFGKDLMVIIKQLAHTQKDQISVLMDELNKAGMQPGEFTSLSLSSRERDCMASISE